MWEDNSGEDHAVSRENWNSLEWGSSKRILTTNCIQLQSISLSRGLPSTPTVGTAIRHPRVAYLMSYSIWWTGVIQNWMFQGESHVTLVTEFLVKISIWSATAWFLRFFVTLWKATIRFSRLSVQLPAWNNSAPFGRIFMKFIYGNFIWKILIEISVTIFTVRISTVI